ncbi:hypothetical protein PENTCL1PPCAC_11513, partial [Pristionchus entomophagus]
SFFLKLTIFSLRMVTLVEWPEITTCLENKRFELVLKNVKASSRTPSVNDEELQERAFPKNSPLNLLYIGGCGLERLSARIEHCANLTNLVLKDNGLTCLPEEIGQLTQLKLIDVSSNELVSLPQSMKNLENLQSLDIAKNKVTTDGLFDFDGLVMLHILEASHNKLTRFPTSLTSESLVKLHTLNFSHNHIVDLPFEFSNVTKMKDIKMEKNGLTDLPLCLGLMDKIRFLDLKGNPFRDTRFRKLANDNRVKVPSVLDYLRRKYDEMEESEDSNEKKKKKNDEETENGDSIKVITHHPSMRVKVLDSVSSIRGFLLTCVIRNIDLSGHNSANSSIYRLDCTVTNAFNELVLPLVLTM